MKQRLENILSGKRCTRSEAKELMHEALDESTNEAQVAAFLTCLRVRGVKPEELMGFADALLELAVAVDLSPHPVIDVCGTGGDGRGSFNISTSVAFVLAGAGYKVAKHGNYGVSSACGSSNVLEELGVPFTTDTVQLRKALEKANACFLHAPHFHPALKRVAPVRKALGFRTVFNMLGPLVNPARPQFQLSGVFDRELLRLYGYVLRERGQRFVIVVSDDGYDEVTLTSPVSVASSQGDMKLTASDFGMEAVKPSELAGGATVQESAQITSRVLEGKGSRAQEDVVVANAALAILGYEEGSSLRECVDAARDSIRSGRAAQALAVSRSTVQGDL